MRATTGDQLDWAKLKPPPYLLGVSLIIWGGLSGHLLLGVFASLMLECHRWLRWRWAFSDQDYIGVWNLCVALIVTVAVFQFVDEEVGGLEGSRVFQLWMPMLLFPMAWTQYFSSGPGVPLLTFSLVARRKRLSDQRAGRRVRPPRLAHMGFFYFVVLLFSIGAVGRKGPSLGEVFGLDTGAGVGSVSTVYLAVAVLLGWALSACIPRRGWMTAALLLVMASYLGHHVHLGLRVLYGFFEGKVLEWMAGGYDDDADRTRTAFGQVGELKLSPKVFWRAKHIEGKRPGLLPEAVYHAFDGHAWRNSRFNQTSPVMQAKSEKQWAVDDLDLADATSVMELRGRVSRGRQLLPRLDDTALIFDLDASPLEKNRLGTLIAEPTYSCLKYSVYSGPSGSGHLEAPADEGIDLEIGKRERREIEKVAKSLSIPKNATAGERIRAVEQFFANPANGFSYTKWLPGDSPSDWGGGVSHISRFLDPEVRSGHCEYYATATVLLLRALEIPARYVVGYALQEYDRGRREFVLRGTHRHAWVRAWMPEERRWINVDTTPSNWFEHELRRLTPLEKLAERWDYWMLSWNLWRSDGGGGLLWALLLLAGVLLVVVLRLIRGLRQSQGEPTGGTHARAMTVPGIDSPWFDLEKSLADREWARPPSQSVFHWSRQLMVVRPEWREHLRPIVEAHYRYRFDPKGIADEERQGLVRAVAAFHEKLGCHRDR